jgi:carboxypeptidase Ss1
MDFLAEAKANEPEMIRIRRSIHQNPELSYKEEATANLVAERLESMGIKVRRGVGGTGVMGTLNCGLGGKVVGLRADMDALPVDETAEVEFKSRNKGVMHACGHDTHVAMLLTAAKILASNRKELHGTIKFFFQPAEEDGGKGGAKPMIEEGVMDDPKVDYVFGLHIEGTTYRSGEFAIRQGAVMAAPDSFKITIKGKGGHGAYPHEAVDPIYIAGQLILALQGVSGRMIDPVQPFVISVCRVQAGTKDNIIPDDALLEGTIRTLDESTRRRAKAKVKKVVQEVSEAFGGRADIQFMEDAYPVTINQGDGAAQVDSWGEGQDCSPSHGRGRFLPVPGKGSRSLLLFGNAQQCEGVRLPKSQLEIQSGRGRVEVRRSISCNACCGILKPEGSLAKRT